MPIRLRCEGCNQLLSIASRKAGQTVRCPACGQAFTVPQPQDAGPAKEPAPPAEPGPPAEEPALAAPRTAAAEPSVLGAAAAPIGAAVGEIDDAGLALRKPATEFEEMDLTPMVDVTFLLLIFFMITASFTIQKTLPFPPPDPDDKGATQSLMELDDLRKDSILVEIDENDAIFVDDDRVDDPSALTRTILDKMRAEDKNELVLTVHPRGRHETTVRVIDAANGAGIQKIRYATMPGAE